MARKGDTTFSVRLTCLREVSPGGGSVKDAAIAYGAKQVIRSQDPWDPNLGSVYAVR